MLLKKEGVDVNAQQYGDGTTPLMLAALEGHLEVCKELLKAGADASLKLTADAPDDKRFRKGLTAYDLAAEADKTAVCDLLKPSRLDPETTHSAKRRKV